MLYLSSNPIAITRMWYQCVLLRHEGFQPLLLRILAHQFRVLLAMLCAGSHIIVDGHPTAVTCTAWAALSVFSSNDVGMGALNTWFQLVYYTVVFTHARRWTWAIAATIITVIGFNRQSIQWTALVVCFIVAIMFGTAHVHLISNLVGVAYEMRALALDMRVWSGLSTGWDRQFGSKSALVR